MGSFSIWHWLVVGVIVLLLFGGKGKISDLMGDFAKGIKSFKKGMQDEDEAKAPAQPEPVRTIEQPAPVQAAQTSAAPQPAPAAATAHAHPHPATEPPKAG